MKDCCTNKVNINWVKKLPSDLCGNSIYFVKSGANIKMYVTNYQGVPAEIGKIIDTTVTITSPDNSINVNSINGQTIEISLSQQLQALITLALQEGDNISLLNNDAQYITIADIPPAETPNLEQILEQGNTATTQIIANGSIIVPDATSDNQVPNLGQVEDLLATKPNYAEVILQLEKGAALGVATLDGGGKIPVSQLPSSLMTYEGTWNALTNTPTLVNGAGDPGMVYWVTVAGTANFGAGPISFELGDWAVYNGTIWQKSLNSNTVVSVAGLQGVVSANDLRVALYNVTNVSIQNSSGVEQFVMTDKLLIEGVTFDPVLKKFKIDALVPLSVFLDPINGNDSTATLENSNKPFKTPAAIFAGLPTTAGETYNIYMTGGTIPVTRRVPARNLNWVSYTPTILDFTNCMEDDGVTHAVKVQRFSTGSFRYHFVNENISMISDYVGLKGWGYEAGTDASAIYITGTLNTLNWKSVGNSNQNGFALKALCDFRIIDCYDSTQNTTVFGGGNIATGSAKVKIDNLRIATGRALASGRRADITVDNIIKVGSGTFTFQTLTNRLSIGSITLDNCIFTPSCNFISFTNSAISALTSVHLQNTVYITGTATSTLYLYNDFLVANTTQIFENFTGKLRNIRHTGSANARVLFKNCNLTVDDSLLIKSGNTNIDIVSFEGYNTITQINTASDLLRSDVTSTDRTIEAQIRGAVTGNIKSFGTYVNAFYPNATFKEKLKEITIRSKKDIVNRTLDSTMNYVIDGVINDLLPTDRIIVPVGGLSLSGYGFAVSSIKALSANSIIFSSPAGGSGNLFLANLALEASGGNSKIFNITNAGAPTGGADAIELNVVNFENCDSLGELTNFRQGLWNNVGIFGVKDGITLSGTWSGGFRSDLTIVRNFGVTSTTSTLFKAGTALLFKSRFWSDLNADFKLAGSISNFTISNFDIVKLFQLKGCQITRNGVIDTTQNYTGTINQLSSVSDWAMNNGLLNSTLQVADAVNSNEAATLGQLNAAMTTLLISIDYGSTTNIVKSAQIFTSGTGSGPTNIVLTSTIPIGSIIFVSDWGNDAEDNIITIDAGTGNNILKGDSTPIAQTMDINSSGLSYTLRKLTANNWMVIGTNQ